MTEPTAIDPSGCGCTECLVGRYAPLDRATPAQILAAQCGVLADHTSGELPALNTTVRDTGHEVSCLPEGDVNAYAFAVEVIRNRRGTWSVQNGGWCLAEGAPGHPHGGRCHIDHQYDEDTALALARKVAPNVVVNGFTVADALRLAQEAGR